MKNILVISIFLSIGLISTACQGNQYGSTQAPYTSPTENNPPMVVLTSAPQPSPVQSTLPVVSSSATSAPPTGSIRGNIGYPSEVVPAMHIVAFLYGTDTYYSVDTELNQTSYKLDGLEEGNYHIVAYTSGSDTFPAGLSGGYTQASVCGMQKTCTDHSLVNVSVDAGQLVEQANIYDWLIPLPPVPQDGQPAQGAITGRLSYPSEFIPPEKVVAFRLEDGQVFSIDTQMNQGEYVLPVPAGTYHVVAYVRDNEGKLTGYAGGYTQAVPCGLSVDCLNHDLIDVVAEQGSVTFRVDPGDFYAPEGAFPLPPE